MRNNWKFFFTNFFLPLYYYFSLKYINKVCINMNKLKKNNDL